MKKILLLDHGRPEPGHGAGERRLSIYNALRKLAAVDILIVPSPAITFSALPGEHVVKLLDDPRQATPWYWRRRNYLLADFRVDRKVADAVRALHQINHYDAFFGRYHLPFLAGCPELGPSFIDVDDLPTERWQSPIQSFNRIRQRVFWKALSRFKTVFVTKRSDIAKAAHPDVRVLPCISTQPGGSDHIENECRDNRMLFVGGAAWPPNREGICQFIEKSLPIIRNKVPDAIVRVVGKQGLTVAGPPGVSAEDFVHDLGHEYRRAKVFVCPIHKGTGSLVKLAEAAAYGQAIVATSFAARGYEGILEGGRDLLIADSDEVFAEQCIHLLRDEALRVRLARNAFIAASTHLTQSNIDGILHSAIGDSMAFSK